MAILDDIRDGKGLKPITPTAQQESICYKQTNADHIRVMTDEELSYYLDGLVGDGCPPKMSQVYNKKRYQCNVRKCWLDWLE